MSEVRELRRLRTFYLGRPGTGDLRLGFAIDGRDYTDPDRLRTDIATAVSVLHQRRLAAQMVTEPVDLHSPRSRAPAWSRWAAAERPAVCPAAAQDALTTDWRW